MEVLVASQGAFKASTGEPGKVEAKVDVVGAEGAKLMLGRMERPT